MAQLNFHVPEALLSRIDASKPEYLDRKGFLCLLIEQSLDKGFTLGKPSAAQAAEPGRGEGFTSKAVSSSSSSSLKEKRDKSKNKAAKYIFSVPPSLDAVKDKLIEFWRDYKDGKKTRAAGGMLITGCQAILDKYGLSVLQEQIDLACANNWQSITLKGYEQFGLVSKKGYTAAEPQHKHPAYRDAADVLAESDRIAQQNLEHLRRKQEESEPATGPLADLF